MSTMAELARLDPLEVAEKILEAHREERRLSPRPCGRRSYPTDTSGGGLRIPCGPLGMTR